MSTKKDKESRDLAQPQAALQRAAQRARELAEQTRTPLVTYRDGKVQKVMVVRKDPARED